jgi:hypothetical protein
MRQIFLLMFLLYPAVPAFSVNVKGPDGYALLGFLLVVVLPVSLYFFVRWLQNRKASTRNHRPLFARKILEISLGKNQKYFPDYLILKVKNKGKADIDIDRPLLEFHKLIFRRKFRLKGSNNYLFYPLILESGKTHDLNIDLKPFYSHDPRLKSYPVIRVTVMEMNGKYSVSRSVKVRKTLFY